MTELKETVMCKICGSVMKDLTSHIFRKHNIKAAEYKQKFQDSPIRPELLLKKQSERIKGDKNPAYQHDGKFSPFSKKFIYTEEGLIEKTARKAADTRTENSNDSTKIDYWLIKTNGNHNEAIDLLKKRQTTFSLDICINKYGEEDGKKVWLDRQEKWHKSYKKSNFSKVSQDLFWCISSKLDNLNDIYFAQLGENKLLDDSGKNNEFCLRLNNNICKPDFLDNTQKKIIEFNGTYWHSVKNHNYQFTQEKDLLRTQNLIDNGYSVLHISEKEYKNDKNGTIEKCLNFLR